MQLSRLIRNRRGSAAVEFALIFPVVMLLYYGMAEGTQALLANRRVGFIATGVGDLAAQRTQLNKAQIADIFNISVAALKPFPTEQLGMRLTSIEINANGVPTQRWTQAHGAAVGDANFSDITETTVGAAFIRAETIYTYQTPFGRIFPTAFTFKHKMDLRPRGGVAVVLLD